MKSYSLSTYNVYDMIKMNVPSSPHTAEPRSNSQVVEGKASQIMDRTSIFDYYHMH